MREGQPEKAAKIPVLGGACVALAAAGITAKATHDVAVSTNFITDSTFAWLAPLGIEGGSVAFAWMVWDCSTRGESAKLQRIGLAFFLAMSMAANLYHVKDKGGFALLEAVFFPLALVLTVEALFGMKRTKERKRRQVAAVSRPATTKVPAPKTPVAPAPVLVDVDPKPVLEAAPTKTTRGKGSPHNETVDALLAENPSITGKAVGEHLGVSDQHGRRLLLAAKKRRDGEAA